MWSLKKESLEELNFLKNTVVFAFDETFWFGSFHQKRVLPFTKINCIVDTYQTYMHQVSALSYFFTNIKFCTPEFFIIKVVLRNLKKSVAWTIDTSGSKKKFYTVMKVLNYRFIKWTYLVVTRNYIYTYLNSLVVLLTHWVKTFRLRTFRECLVVSGGQG